MNEQREKMINLVYIDDKVDPMLDKYLNEDGLAILEQGSTYNSIRFEPSLSYTDLLRDKRIQEASIVIIDSQLFENSNADIKFSGEEVSLLFKKYYPFIETILISQNDLNPDYSYVKKFYDRLNEDYISYYKEHLSQKIQIAHDRVIQSRLFLEKLKNNEELDQCLKDRLINSVNGIVEYDDLSKADIDNLIIAFKELENKIHA